MFPHAHSSTISFAILLALGVPCLGSPTPRHEALTRSFRRSAAVPIFFVAEGTGAYTLHGLGLRAEFQRGRIRFASSSETVELSFPGANLNPAIEAFEPETARVHWITDELSTARTETSVFSGVRYHNLYPGIDLLCRAAGPKLNYEFVVAPGVDPGLIRISYGGVQGLAIDSPGILMVRTAAGEFLRSTLAISQGSGDPRTRVPGTFHIPEDGSIAAFWIGEYNRSRSLTISLSNSFSTYFGGSRFDAANAVALDGAGNIYITGWSESNDLPISSAFQQANGGGVDVFVAKLDPTGSRLLYCTYLGGSGEDRGAAIAVDASGSAYITGSTTSPNFPVTAAAFVRHSSGGRDAFVVKLSPAGNQLIYSTYLGGNGADSGRSIAVDAAGNAYVAGETFSSNFPVFQPVQASSGGQLDAFVTELDPTGTILRFSTYLGGRGDDTAAAIAVDSTGAIYLTGATTSTDFPIAGALQPVLAGTQNGFVAKIIPVTSSIAYSTYLGGSGAAVGRPEMGTGIAVDSSGDVYVTGMTSSSNFPVQNAFQAALKGSTDAFVAKLNPIGNALLYSTYLGGSSIDLGNAISIDASSDACVTGATASPDFPTVNPLQPSNAGTYNVFIACLAPGGNSLTFSTLLGGSGSDAGNDIMIRGSSIYVVGQTTSGNFPIDHALQTFNGGNYGAFAASLSMPSGLQFFPVPPCRILDTRVGSKTTGAFGPPSISARTSRSFPIPSSSCGIPASAKAYAVNVTAVPYGFLGYLTIWPTGQPQPLVSTLNSWNGLITANAAIVPAGADGSVSIYASDTTDVFMDISGYFGPPSESGLEFVPVTPCRILDTRAGASTTGAFGPPSISARTSRSFPVPSSSCGIPASAKAYAVNVTAVPYGFLGYLTIWPTGQAQPLASTLNSWNGLITANAAIVPAGANGAFSIYTSDKTDVFVDINGYFASPTGLKFYPITPCRLVDTRTSANMDAPFGPPSISARTFRTFPVPSGSCRIPISAAAYSLNVTAVPYGFLGYLAVWPTGQPTPLASTLNSWNGSITANAAIVQAGSGGSINVYASDTTDVFIDINGYLAP